MTEIPTSIDRATAHFATANGPLLDRSPPETAYPVADSIPALQFPTAFPTHPAALVLVLVLVGLAEF